MSMFRAFEIAGSALSAQSLRLNVVASNLANVDSAAGPDGKTYQARQVVFEAVPVQSKPGVGMTQMPQYGQPAAQSVRVREVTTDEKTPPRLVYDPKHPMADEKGYVAMPNVNPVDEMVNLISASRAYQNNVEVMNTARTLLQKTLQMGS